MGKDNQSFGIRPPFNCRSTAMAAVLRSVKMYAATKGTVLIEGATGTGKEGIAEAIHHQSQRIDHKFIRVNCATIRPENAVSTLFGHKRGSFTGADREVQGLFRDANRGTVFLDELSALPRKVQPMLLRFLDDGKVNPMGTSETFDVDVRVICASSEPLQQLVDAERFDKALYYRLARLRVLVPTLEARRDDIAPAIDYTMRRLGYDLTVDPQQLLVLTLAKWPGNFRELANAIELAGIRAMDRGSRVIEQIDLFPDTGPMVIGDTINELLADVKGVAWKRIDLAMRRHVLEVLTEAGLSHNEMEVSLGLNRTTLYKWRRELGMVGTSARSSSTKAKLVRIQGSADGDAEARSQSA